MNRTGGITEGKGNWWSRECREEERQMEEIETMKNNESVFINIFNEVKRQNKQTNFIFDKFYKYF
jgi:hypothetical protein